MYFPGIILFVMTRINLVDVRDLADQHLFAEWREIKMIAPAARRSLASKSSRDIGKNIPPAYTLNTGHVTFFYNKLAWLQDRYALLTDEVLQRGYNIDGKELVTEDYLFALNHIDQMHWSPTITDIQCSIDRIAERLQERPNWYRYYGDVFAPDFFIDRYNQRLLFDKLAA